MRIVAVDIGGTMIKSGLWNGETFVELRETETRASEGGAALMERVKGLIHSYHDFGQNRHQANTNRRQSAAIQDEWHPFRAQRKT